jgi:hypothetical protein
MNTRDVTYDPIQWIQSNILNKDGTVNYYGKILSSEEANQYFGLLMQNILWGNEVIIFGKHIVTKRKAAWYGDS